MKMKCGLILSLALLAPTLAMAQDPAPTVRFTEISQQSGVRMPHDPLGFETASGEQIQDLYGPGVAVEDFNGDGLLDLFYCNGAEGNHLFLNDGGWQFTEVTAEMGVGPSNVANGIAIADFDNDGRRDFVLGNFYAEPELYRKGQRFGEIASIMGLHPLLPGADPFLGPVPESMGAAWGDYNEDGFVDLYIANYRDQQDVLYKNNGGGLFTYDPSVSVTQQGYGFQALYLDYDDDGDLDIYVANDFGYNFMFRNNGAESGYDFDEVALVDGEVAGEGMSSSPKGMSMGLAVGDFDNDLDQDIYVTNFQLNALYKNDGPSTKGTWLWKDVALRKGVEYPINCWGVDFVDLDHDTDLDIVQASGYIWSDVFDVDEQPRDNPDQVWLNNGPDFGYTFTNVSDESGFNSTMMARGLATGDIDRDGDIDILVGNNTYYFPGPDDQDRPDFQMYTGEFLLYRNDQDFGNNWLTLRLVGQAGILEGSVANRSGIGARIWVTTTSGLTMMREVQSGASFMSHNSLEVEFGLGQADVAEVKVRWPGQEPGEEEIFEGIAANSFWRLVEGEGSAIRVPTTLVSFGARNLDRGIMIDWVSAAGVRTTTVDLLRAPAETPWDLVKIHEADVTIDQDGGQAFDPTAVDGERYVYQLRLTTADGFVTLSAQVEIEVRHDGQPRVRRAVVGQNFPNPFNPNTSIIFELPRTMEARLEIYDVRGRRVRTLFSGTAAAGKTTIDWDGLDDAGRSVASGVYTYALVTEDGTSARRMTLVK
jgi:hypothetical protein